MKKLIKCKSCGAEIAKDAKTCPQCGAKNKKSILKRWWFWVIVVAVVLTVIGNSGGSDGTSDTPETQGTNVATATDGTEVIETTEATTEPAALTIGDEAILGDWSITVTDFSFNSKISGNYGSYFTPENGNQYAVVSVTVFSNAQDADTFLPTYGLSGDVHAKIVYDGTYDYSATNLLAHDDDLHDSHMNPLTTQTGIIAFQIPDSVVEAEGSLVLKFTEGFDSVEFALR